MNTNGLIFFSVSELYSFNPDPAKNLNPDGDPEEKYVYRYQ